MENPRDPSLSEEGNLHQEKIIPVEPNLSSRDDDTSEILSLR